MNLGIYLSMGDSLENMARSGQRSRFIEYYLKPYARGFKKVYLFTYENETANDLPKNVVLVPNKFKLNRFLYGFLMPFVNRKYVKSCDIFRAFHLLGTLPAIMGKIFLGKRYAFNFAYDYFKFAEVEDKKWQLFFLKLLFFPAKFLATKIFAANYSVQKMLPKRKIIYLPNGVNIKIFKANLKSPKRRLKILSIGRLEKQKNYQNLVKSLKGLKVSLTLIGQGSLKETLIELAKKEKVKLELINYIDNQELPKIYNNFDIFILPSLIEGSPKVLLEAMACGMPVVASKVEGNKDVIEDGVDGIFCSTDVKSINRAVKKILNDHTLRKKLGKSAREKIEKEYNLAKIVNREIKALKNL